MSDLAWTKAAALLKLDRATGWPASLDLLRLSVLQAGLETKEQRDEARAICATLLDACKAGTLPCEAEEHTSWPRYTVVHQGPTVARRNLYGERIYTPPPPPPPQRTTTVYRLSPATFATWLAGEGLTPSPLVAAWFKATGTTTSEAPAELAQPAAGVKAGSAHRPSDEDLLQELERRGGRETRGALQKTADHFRLDRSMVGKAIKRAEQARIAKYGKNHAPPKDALTAAWGRTGKNVKPPLN